MKYSLNLTLLLTIMIQFITVNNNLQISKYCFYQELFFTRIVKHFLQGVALIPIVLAAAFLLSFHVCYGAAMPILKQLSRSPPPPPRPALSANYKPVTTSPSLFPHYTAGVLEHTRMMNQNSLC